MTESLEELSSGYEYTDDQLLKTCEAWNTFFNNEKILTDEEQKEIIKQKSEEALKKLFKQMQEGDDECSK